MFQELQEAAADFARMIPPLAAVKGDVHTRLDSDLDNIIERKLIAGRGLAITVLYPFPEVIYTEAPGLNAAKISLQIQIDENAAINKTGISCLQAAEFIHRAMHLWIPGTDGLGSNALVAEEKNVWKDPPTKAGRNQIIVLFRTAGVLPAIDVVALSFPLAGNYRIQNSLQFQLYDIADESSDFTTIWAAPVNGVVSPLLSDIDDVGDNTGVPFMPKVGANYRIKNNQLLQFLNPASGNWHTPFIETNAGAPSVMFEQTPDAATVPAIGSAPLIGSNYRLKDKQTLQLIGRDGLFRTILSRKIDNVKYLLAADDGEAA